MQIISVNASTKYEVKIDSHILNKAAGWTKELSNQNYKKIAVITDSNVSKLYAETVILSYKQADYEAFSYVFKAGELAKNIQNVLMIVSWLIENSFTRSDLLVALGGGVCGDLVGFISSIYLRGVDFIQIPTTFLSAIDSSVGGKTAINIPQGKNLVGTFYQPRLVICDSSTLSTLSKEDFNSGVAEAIKCGCIWDKNLFFKFRNKNWIKNELEEIIARCLEIKAEVVEKDEKDNGIRGILNWGHTIGHAIEKLSNLKVSHGYGVAIGMCIVAKAGETAGITKIGTAEQIQKTLAIYDIPYNTAYSAKEIVKACLGDKKRQGDVINFITLKEIGICKTTPIEINKLEEFIEGGL